MGRHGDARQAVPTYRILLKRLVANLEGIDPEIRFSNGVAIPNAVSSLVLEAALMADSGQARANGARPAGPGDDCAIRCSWSTRRVRDRPCCSRRWRRPRAC